jgi:hypothetical protein
MKRLLLIAAVLLISMGRYCFGQTLVHYWNFNTTSSEAAHLSASYTSGGGALTYTLGATTVVDVAGGTGQNFNVLNLNARNGDASGNHLRFNNPIGGTLVFSLPTTGFSDPVVKYTTRRSGSGAGTQQIAYSVDGTTFVPFTTVDPVDGDPTLQTLDFSSIAAADNNPLFKIQIGFIQGSGGAVGNNRFDNFTLDATPAGADNIPPSVSFLPLSGATVQPVTTTPTITFNEPVRRIDNSAITNDNVDALVELRTGNASGGLVAFDATISGNVITITPLAALAAGQQYYVALKANVVEDLSDNAVVNVQSSTFTTIAAQTVFTPGDILLVAYQMNAVPNEDRIAFVTLVNILPGTILTFTDAKYTSNNPAQCPGGIIWTAPATGVTAGTVITINNDAGTASAGSITGSTFGLSANGDQVIVYAGSNTNPQFITALSSNAWIASNTSCGGSASMLPASLTDGMNSINLSTAPGNTSGNTVNAYYTGSMNGTLASLKASITNPANWIGTASASPAQTWPNWAFPGPPVVVSAQAINGNTIRVIFNRDLDPVSATTLTNFTGISGLQTITRTDNGALNDTLFLTYSNSFVSGSSYTLTVSGVKDSEGRALAAPFVYTFSYNTTIAFNAQVLSVLEDAGKIQLQLNLANPSASSVKLVVKNAFSTAGNTDVTIATQTLNFTGSSNNTQIIEIPVNDDNLEEQDEYLVLALEEPSGLTVSGNNFITIYIRDNDKKAPVPSKKIELSYLGSYDPSGSTNASTEIVAYDSISKRLFVTSALQDRLDIADFSDPAAIKPIKSIDMTPYGGVTSVAVKNGIVAVAAPNADEQQNGSVVFFNTDGVFQSKVTVGPLPDMVAFTPDGKKLLSANEGQPNDAYTIDPEGSVSIIDISAGVAGLTQDKVTTVDFTAFNAQTAALVSAGVRRGNPATSLSQNMEPEFICFTPDGKTAWVILQESNAFAVLDLTSNKVTDIWPLGMKDHSLPGNGFDASDRGNIHIANWPVKGIYMPDGIASYTINGVTYLVGANEGDDREYSGYNERLRINDPSYKLDPVKFPNAAILKNDNNLGRLRITTASGDTDGDGDFDEIHLIGGRSFAIWNANTKAVVYDSKDDFEQYLAKTPQYTPIFNTDHESNGFKARSTSKGPEPEGLTLANIDGAQYAFITLERQGGVMVYDITNPMNVKFVDYKNPRNLTSYGGDNGPEGIIHISNTASPDGKHYILVANEISGTISIYRITNTADCTPVDIITGPVNPAPVNNGSGTATFSVKTNTTDKVIYQWQENGVNIKDDSVYSGTNTATLKITNPRFALNGKKYRVYVTNCLGNNSDTSNTAVLTVRETPALIVSDVTVDENVGNAIVNICLSAPTSKPVTFNYSTANGTAYLLLDYMLRIGSKTIPAGQTCTSISIPIIDLPIPEDTEHFFLNVSNASNAVIQDGQGKITILDDDRVPTITISDVTVNENAGKAVLNVCLSETSNKTVSVLYTTSNGTALAGQDYRLAIGFATIAPGKTCDQITVSIIDDNKKESTEYFNVNLSLALNGSIADRSAKVTIIDNDGNSNNWKYGEGSDEEQDENKITIAPNPFVHDFRVMIRSEVDEQAVLQLTDLSGRLLRTINVQLRKGSNQFNVDALQKLNAGTYLLRVTTRSRAETMKVVKQP